MDVSSLLLIAIMDLILSTRALFESWFQIDGHIASYRFPEIGLKCPPVNGLERFALQIILGMLCILGEAELIARVNLKASQKVSECTTRTIYQKIPNI
jgi:hypothetical protein